MSDVVVHGPASWNLIVDLHVLPDPTPHMQFAAGHRELLGGTSAGKAAHLRDLGVDVALHTVLGADAPADAIEEALRGAGMFNRAYLRSQPQRTPPEPNADFRTTGSGQGVR